MEKQISSDAEQQTLSGALEKLIEKVLEKKVLELTQQPTVFQGDAASTRAPSPQSSVLSGVSLGGGGLPGLFKEVAREQAEVVNFNSTQLVKLLKEEGKLKSSVKDIVTWLENKTGRELKMPTAPIKLKDFDG